MIAPPARSSARGMALLSMLLILALIVGVATALAGLGRQAVTTRAALEQRAQARLLAEAGIARAQFLLQEGLDRETGRAGPLRIHTEDLEPGRIVLAFRDLCGLVDLNQAPVRLLEAGLRTAGLAAQRARLLAERMHERRRESPYEHVEALAADLVDDGVSADRLHAVFTVHCRLAGLDPAAAPEDLLRHLPGLERGALEFFLERRRDDPAAPLPPLAGGAGLFAASHGLGWRVRAEGRLEAAGTTVSRTILADLWLTDRRDSPILVLDWREGTAADAGRANRAAE